MLMLVLTWIGIALGTTLLLLMALGPAIVELDSLVAQRRRRAPVKTAAVKTATVKTASVAAVPVLHG
jgi:hypothetical protein